MQKELLRILHDSKDRFLSLTELSSILTLSHKNIISHIELLQNGGYIIEDNPKLGYRLLSVPDRLFPDEIQIGLETRLFGRHIWAYEEVQSTNIVAKDIASRGGPEGGVVIAERQTAGYGRQGKRWFSPRNKGLWFSVILRPNLKPAYSSMITIASSVAVAKAVIKHLGVSVWIKWPNDIYINNKKAGGILTEINIKSNKIAFAVLGIGINTNLEQGHFPEGLRDRACSINCFRPDLLKNILKELENYYDILNKNKWKDIIDEWKSLSLVSGKRIKLKQGGKAYEGQVLGIDEHGALILRQDNGFIEYINSGDIQCYWL